MIRCSKVLTAQRFEAAGVLHYEILDSGSAANRYSGYKLTLEGMDKGISLFYRSLIPKSKSVKPQMFPPHISVVRRETPLNLEAWGAHEGRKVIVHYDPYVHEDATYYWVECFSEELEDIREELGLPRHRGNFSNFHMTLGNKK
jgi:hypothetical protein